MDGDPNTDLQIVMLKLRKIVRMFDFKPRTLDNRLIKDLKDILKNNGNIIESFGEQLIEMLGQQNSDKRFAMLLVCEELFKRSHLFRQTVVHLSKEFLTHTAELDPHHYPLPPPKDAAKILKFEALKLFKSWHDNYAHGYPKLRIAYDALLKSKAFDLERMQIELQVERAQSDELERRNIQKSVRIIEIVENEFNDRKNDIERCLDETKHAIELLVPRFDAFDDSDPQPGPSTRKLEDVHGYGRNDLITITLPSAYPSLKIGSENEAVVNSLIDCQIMLKFFEKAVNKWLTRLAKCHGRSAEKTCKKLIDVKRIISIELERCKELKIPIKKVSQRPDSDSDTDDDLLDVPEKEGLELNFKPPEEIPEYILKKIRDDQTSGRSNIINSEPGLSASLDAVSLPPKSKSGVPILSYGLDLKYWGERDITPAEVPRNDADCHKFWRPSDDGCSTTHDIPEAYSSRVITFVGDDDKTNRMCRAPLKNGSLCSRNDRRRCPLHGIIIDRDEMGFPLEEASVCESKKKVKDADEEEFIKDIELATGANLSGDRKNRKRREENTSESSTSRDRLSTKLFNKRSLKRVYDTLDNIRKANAAKKFAHQFNYALSRK